MGFGYRDGLCTPKRIISIILRRQWSFVKVDHFQRGSAWSVELFSKSFQRNQYYHEFDNHGKDEFIVNTLQSFFTYSVYLSKNKTNRALRKDHSRVLICTLDNGATNDLYIFRRRTWRVFAQSCATAGQDMKNEQIAVANHPLTTMKRLKDFSVLTKSALVLTFFCWSLADRYVRLSNYLECKLPLPAEPPSPGMRWYSCRGSNTSVGSLRQLCIWAPLSLPRLLMPRPTSSLQPPHYYPSSEQSLSSPSWLWQCGVCKASQLQWPTRLACGEMKNIGTLGTIFALPFERLNRLNLWTSFTPLRRLSTPAIFTTKAGKLSLGCWYWWCLRTKMKKLSVSPLHELLRLRSLLYWLYLIGSSHFLQLPFEEELRFRPTSLTPFVFDGYASINRLKIFGHDFCFTKDKRYCWNPFVNPKGDIFVSFLLSSYLLITHVCCQDNEFLCFP